MLHPSQVEKDVSATNNSPLPYVCGFETLLYMFSKELIQYAIRYFGKKYQHEISEETAELYLNQCAELFGTFYSLLEAKQHASDEASVVH